ncbi:ABC transporter substrate-binding protein [Pokkaliibacter sp. MBI-7]|uniref:ABC transporter substrate-binding protein n=1 Tax=Pokkaliibacter sp. MBI-7 TaxID=3040600 RepID=UPI00244B17C1|nr:ABC transporter substrate-binding protein [Pokkaliibacter sp. MBI-7]MDH2432897.1 ABC transporter substrate-binding protein [Pokkaliibacter sp. MBI-7]
MKAFAYAAGSIGLACALIFGAPAQAESNLEQTKVSIAVGGKTLFYYLPLTIAEQKGFFKEEGLDVEISDLSGGSKALQALVGGSADVVSGSYEHTISMQAKGQDIVAFVVEGNAPGIVLGVAKSKADKITSAKDLKGLNIGVTAPGSSTHMYVKTLLVKAGLSPDDISAIGVGAGAGAVAALEHGEVDAVANLDPVIAKLEADDAIKVMYDTRTKAGVDEVYGGDYHAAVLYTKASYLHDNPHTSQALANAIVHALKWMASATPEEIVNTVPEAYYGGDKALYTAALKANLGSYSKTGEFSAEATEHVLAVLKAFDEKVQKATIDLSKTYDDQFAKAAQSAVK